jgi:hypothetical protein
MPHILIIIAAWVVGIVIGKRMDKTDHTPDNPHTPSVPPEQLSKFEALKAIRESAFARWDKRRSYEWQLSISIWTALAALSGLALNKDFPVEPTVKVVIIACGISVLIVACHGYYLWKMFDHTIADAAIQRYAEQQMYELAFGEPMPERDPKLPEYKLYPVMSKYGIIQIVITLLLAFGAVGCILATRHTEKQGTQPQTIILKFSQ